MQQKYFDATSIAGTTTHRIAYTEWGDPANPKIIVCVHGLTRNSRDFDFLAATLQNDYRIICPDVPGRGKSEWLKDSTDYTNSMYMADLLGLLTYLAIPSCDWVGTSMGGIIGMMIAALSPERIDRLVLNDVGAYIPAAALKRIIEYIKTPRDFLSRMEAESYLRTAYTSFGIREEIHWQHIFSHSLVERGVKMHMHYDPAIIDAFRNDTKNFTGIKDVNLWPLWQRVNCPVLLLRGTESDLLSRETAEKMRADNSDTAYAEFPGIGHAPTLMPAEQIAIVRDWLKQN